jgi:L-fucose mutarotase/ribose pyranase (RbsD/FucU family)
MLKNISPILSPELLKILMEMGHGDEIVIGDGNDYIKNATIHFNSNPNGK